MRKGSRRRDAGKLTWNRQSSDASDGDDGMSDHSSDRERRIKEFEPILREKRKRGRRKDASLSPKQQPKPPPGQNSGQASLTTPTTRIPDLIACD